MHYTLSLIIALTTIGVLLPVNAAAQQTALSGDQPQQTGAEVGLVYGSAFLGTGDVNVRAFRGRISKEALTDWTGIQAQFSYQRRVETSLRQMAISGFYANRLNYTAELALYADVLQFRAGSTRNRLRIAAGPSMLHQTGEMPRHLMFPGSFGEDPTSEQFIQDKLRRNPDYNFYSATYEDLPPGNQTGKYGLFTQTLNERYLGAALRLSYGITFQSNLTLSVDVGTFMSAGPNTLEWGIGLAKGW